VVWRFTPEAAADARLYLFHPTQVMIDEPDGSLTVSFRAGGLREMCWHLFRWGDQVEIVQPKALAEALSRLLNLSLKDALKSQRHSPISR
jgi:predicted DNA-binding transcriptional regulator YafY